jgi:hypothetical protein
MGKKLLLSYPFKMMGAKMSQEKQDDIFEFFICLKNVWHNNMRGLGFGLSCLKTLWKQ